MAITFTEVSPKNSWEEKRWEVTAGKYYLGKIVKRHKGRGFSLDPYGKPGIIYHCMPTIQVSEHGGLGWGDLQYKKKYKFAKKAFKKQLRLYVEEIQK